MMATATATTKRDKESESTPNQFSNTNEWGYIATTMIQITFDTQCDPLITHHNVSCVHNTHTHRHTYIHTHNQSVGYHSNAMPCRKMFQLYALHIHRLVK